MEIFYLIVQFCIGPDMCRIFIDPVLFNSLDACKEYGRLSEEEFNKSSIGKYPEMVSLKCNNFKLKNNENNI